MPFDDLHRPLGAAGFRGAVRFIIVLSGILLVLQQFFGWFLLHFLGLTPVHVLRDGWWWQLFTYSFFHGGLFHWLFNMFILWMFGRELEVRWGSAYFLRYYFATALGAGLLVLLLTPHSTTPTIGASGAIFGLLVAFAMNYPDAVLYLYFVIPMKAWQAAAFFAVIELFAGFEGGGSGIARFAHLGGMATGFVYLRYGWQITAYLKRPFRNRSIRWNIPARPPRRKVEFHEVTDELVKEVDGILDKILKQGVDSLTPHEKDIMERYSKMKH